MATREGSGRRAGSTAAGKASTKKATPRKAATKKAATKKAASGPKVAARPKSTATQVAAQAARQLLELTGREAEGITGLDRDEDGWTVQVEVVEVRRIPDTTDVLGLYEVRTDERGDLQGYKRVRRYTRGAAGGD